MLLGTTILSVTACVKEEENNPPVQPEPGGGGQEEDEDEDEKREVQPLDIREIIVTVDEQGKADGNHRFQKINETNFYIDDIKYRVEDGELVVCGYSPFFEGDAVIISALRYQGSTMKVTRITDGAFRESESESKILKTCIVGTEVTTIGRKAFEGCSNLEAVAIPRSVKCIGGNAFRYCYELYSVHITDLSAWCKIDFKIDEEIISYKYNYTTTSNPLAHAHHLYLDNQEVTELTIPSDVTTIKQNTFAGYWGLTAITIPDHVTSIGAQAFALCRWLTSVNIPSSVTSIGQYAFSGCEGLTSVTIPSNIRSIDDAVFAGCLRLTSISIPDRVTSLGKFAFYECSALTSVTIPNSVTDIGEKAFHGCLGLTSVTIGSSVTNIAVNAFYYCTALTDVYCTAVNPPSAKDAFTNSPISSATLHVPAQSLEAYKAASPWSEFGAKVAL